MNSFCKKRLWWILLAFCFVALFRVTNASALTEKDTTLRNKALATSIISCYTNDSFKSKVTSEEFNSYSGARRFMKDETIKNGGLVGGINGDLANDSYSNCMKFIDAVKTDIKIDNLVDLGYTQKESGSNEKCISFNFKGVKGISDFTTDAICATLDDNGKITKVDFNRTGNEEGKNVINFADNGAGGIKYSACQGVRGDGTTTDCSDTQYLGLTWDSFTSSLTSKMESFGVNASYPAVDQRTLSEFYYAPPPNTPGVDSVKGEYVLGTPNSSIYSSATKFLIGQSFAQVPRYSNADIFALYQNYLRKYYGATVGCDTDKVSQYEANNAKKIKFYDGNSIKECYAMNPKKDGNVNGIKNQKFVVDSVSYDALVDWLASSSVTANQLSGFTIDTSEGKPLDEDEDEEREEIEETCRNSKGAESLGWIVCPFLSWAGNAATELYEKIVEPRLQVDPTLFNSKAAGENNVEKAWQSFRDIANIIFIILLLIVIFSQLTGIGIDNYGIKKVLPRLIIAAILINLSYLICMILVDLSNILGNGFQGMFDALGSELHPTIKMDGVAFNGGSAGEEVDIVSNIASVGVFGALVTGVGLAFWGGAATVLSLLISGIGVLISLFFLFILLAAREAIIIILVAISPLAVVAYMLPNTKKLFDKWWKMLEGLLLVYPIAGLLVGGGNYVSKLLLVNAPSDFFAWITAMVIGVMPIFFLPMVLKSAFSAMGKVGGLLTGLGTGARGRVTKMAGESGLAKNVRQGSLERQTRWKAGIDRNGDPASGWRRHLGTVLSGGANNRRRSALQYKKMLSDRGSLEATEGEDFMLRTQAANEMKRLESTGDVNVLGSMTGTGGPSGLTGGLYDALVSGDRAKIVAYTDALSAKGEDGRKAVKSAYNAAVSAGMGGEAASTFANNILANHAADYKNNSRSMFAVAQGINMGGAAQTTGNYLSGMASGGGGAVMSGQAALANKVTATTMGNMDDDAFDEIFAGGVIPAGADAASIGAAAYAALNDQNANIKAERRAKLESIVATSGYTPEVQQVDFSAGGRADNAIQDLNATARQTEVNTGNAAVAAAQGAAYAGRTAVNTGSMNNKMDDTNRYIRRTAINTNRGANAAEQTVLNTRQTAINTNRTVKAVKSIRRK